MASLDVAEAEFEQQLDTTAGLRAPRRRRSGRSGSLGVGRLFRWVVLPVVGLYFVIPILASLRFSLQQTIEGGWTLDNYRTALTQPASFLSPGFWPTFSLSLEIAAGSAAITVVLLVPTIIWTNLRLPKLRPLLDSLSILPLAVPAVVLVFGLFNAFQQFPNFFTSPMILVLIYVVLALPFTYRAISAGVRSIDLHVLVDASRSLGANSRQMLFGVLLPNIKGSVFSAIFLMVALAFGEFAIVSLMSFNTFPVFINMTGQTDGFGGVALSMFALFVVWALLLLLTFATRSRKGSRGAR